MVAHHCGLQALTVTREWLNSFWQMEPTLIYRRRWEQLLSDQPTTVGYVCDWSEQTSANEITCVQFRLNEFRCYEAKIEESEKQDTSCKYSATDPRQLDNHLPSHYSIHGTECLSRTPGHHQNSIRGQLANPLCQERTCAEWFLTLNAQSILPQAKNTWVHIENCEGWWLSGCHGSVAEHWLLKLVVFWVRLLPPDGLFTFLYFRFITSKFIAWGKILWEFRLMSVSYSQSHGIAGNLPTY